MGYADEVLADSPAAYWRLGEASGITAADASGNGRAGTYTPNSGGSWTGGTLGQAGALAGDADAAALFNGSGGHALLAASALGNSPAEWTLEAWVKAAAQSNRFALALGRGTATNPFIGIGSGITTTSALRINYRSDAGATQIGAEGGTAFDGAWHHLAYTFAAGTARGYVDGVEVVTVGPAVVLGAITLDRTAAGALVRTSAGLFLAGAIDEAAVYATALSAARILAHYNAGVTAAAGGLLPRLMAEGLYCGGPA